MIVFYDLPKLEQQWIKINYPKLSIQFKAGKLNLQNLPSTKTEILSIHSNCEVNSDVLAKLPNLKLIATRTTGVDHVDLNVCKKNKVNVINAAGMNAQSVSEFTFGLVINATRQINAGINRVKKGDFNDKDLLGTELAGKTFGVIGTGSVGSGVLRIAKGFGMKILAHDAFENAPLKKELKVKYVPLKEIFEKSDIISLHVPGTPKTRHMVNARTLKLLKTTAGIVNTARGSIVNSKDLFNALKLNNLAWYAADVLEVEHNIFKDKVLGKINRQLVNHERSFITPHMAYGTEEAVRRVTVQTMDQIQAFLRNKPVKFII